MTTKTSKPKGKRTRWRIDGLDFFVVYLPTAILLFGLASTTWPLWATLNTVDPTCQTLDECRARSVVRKARVEAIEKAVSNAFTFGSSKTQQPTAVEGNRE